MFDTPCSEVVWRVLATHSIHPFPLHFPSRASPCAITFQLESTTLQVWIPQLGIRKMSKINNLICPLKNVRNHTLSTCCLWFTVVVGENISFLNGSYIQDILCNIIERIMWVMWILRSWPKRWKPLHQLCSWSGYWPDSTCMSTPFNVRKTECNITSFGRSFNHEFWYTY